MRARFALPAPALLAVVTLVVTLAPARPAAASWVRDRNQNRIDDVLESVNTHGLSAAHEHGDVNARALIFVHPEDAPLTYDVYVGFDHHPTDADASAVAAAGARVTWRARYIDYVRARATYGQIQALAARAGVTRVEARPVLYAFNDNATRTLRARSASGGVGNGAGLFPSVWQNLGITGKGVVVGIIDTGVNDQPTGSYPGHESLRGKFVGGGDFSNEESSQNTPPDSSVNPQNAADPLGDYHGTHVAGTAIGSGGPTGVLGGAAPGTYAGIAPDARLVDCKALSDAGVGGGSSEALEWCIAHMNTTWTVPNPDAVYKGVQVVNMSLGSLLGGTDGSDADAQEVNAAVRAGIVVCVATGNDGSTGDISSPASADMALAVGAFDDRNSLERGDDIVSDYSNEGPRLDDGDTDHFDEMSPSVLGDGSDILSALGDPSTNGDRYHNINGTSMATPCVAGLCALIKQANPNLSPVDVREIVRNTADHRTDNGKQLPSAVDPYHLDPNYHPSWGWGQPDAYAAVKEALGGNTTQVIAEWAPTVALVGGQVQITVQWTTQREIGATSFSVWRASDVSGHAGSFAAASTSVAPAGRATIERTPNRTTYTWTDADPALVAGNTYWYQVRWTDTQDRVHTEPAFVVATDVKPTRARVAWSIAHNTIDNDIAARFGSGTSIYTPVFVRSCGGSTLADSFKTITPVGFGGPLKQYFFHTDLTDDDVVAPFLAPSAANPWFLAVLEKGYVNTNGQVESFAVTVYDGTSSTTYTAVNPPTQTVEGQTTVFWIPADPATSLNHTPVLEPIGDRSVGEGLTLNFQIQASDADGQGLTYSATGLASGATFTPGSRTFDWTPSFGQAGTYTVVFHVQDTMGAADSEAVAITVTPRTAGSNTAPELAPIPDWTVRTSTTLTFTVSATDNEGGTLTYSAAPLPGTSSFNASTRTFSWTPDTGEDGTYGLTFHVVDAAGAADSQAVLITVTPGGTPPPPPGECAPDTTVLTGTIGTGANGVNSDTKFHPFTVAANTQQLRGSLQWLGGPAIDLDFYLLDAAGNQVKPSASLDDPEVITVNGLAAGAYQWEVVAFTNPNPSLEYTITSVACVTIPTAVGDLTGGAQLALSPAAPNPFHGFSSVRFSLPEAGRVRLDVFDANGRLVRTLVNGDMKAGIYQRVWNGTTQTGTPAPSGLYFYRLATGQGRLSRTAMLVR